MNDHMKDLHVRFYEDSFLSKDQFDEYVGMVKGKNFVLRINLINSTFCIDNLARDIDTQETYYGYLISNSENSKTGVIVYITNDDTYENELYGGRYEKSTFEGIEVRNLEFIFKDNNIFYEVEDFKCEFELSK